VCVCVASGFLF